MCQKDLLSGHLSERVFKCNLYSRCSLYIMSLKSLLIFLYHYIVVFTNKKKTLKKCVLCKDVLVVCLFVFPPPPPSFLSLFFFLMTVMILNYVLTRIFLKADGYLSGPALS